MRYRPYNLKGRVRALEFDFRPFVPVEWGRVLRSRGSATIQTKVGTFGKGDLLVWRSADRVLHVGRAISFIELFLGDQERYLAMAVEYNSISGLKYSPPADEQKSLIDIETCLGNFSWVVHAGNIVEILLPVGI